FLSGIRSVFVRPRETFSAPFRGAWSHSAPESEKREPFDFLPAFPQTGPFSLHFPPYHPAAEIDIIFLVTAYYKELFTLSTEFCTPRFCYGNNGLHKDTRKMASRETQFFLPEKFDFC